MTTTVELFDKRDPMKAGEAIIEDMLNGKDVVADSEALAFAFLGAAELVGDEWRTLAERASMDDWDLTEGETAVAWQRVSQATEVAERVLAALSRSDGS